MEPQTMNLKGPGTNQMFSFAVFMDLFFFVSEFVILTRQKTFDSTEIAKNRSMVKRSVFSSGLFEPRICHSPQLLFPCWRRVGSFSCFRSLVLSLLSPFFCTSPHSFIVHLRLDRLCFFCSCNWDFCVHLVANLGITGSQFLVIFWLSFRNSPILPSKMTIFVQCQPGLIFDVSRYLNMACGLLNNFSKNMKILSIFYFSNHFSFKKGHFMCDFAIFRKNGNVAP